MKTLVVAPSWIGDAVLSHPLLVRLKEADREGTIDVLAPPWVEPVYRHMPEVARTIANPFGHGDLRLGERRRFAKDLAAYDQAVVLANTLKSALIPWHAGIRKRTGWRGEGRYVLLNDMRKLDEEALPLIVERYAALAQPRGEDLRRPVPQPRLTVAKQATGDAIARHGLAGPGAILALAPGAEYGPAKRWPARHFAAVSRDHLAAGGRVWLFGSAKDAPIAEEIRTLAGGACRNLAGKTSLDEAIALIAAADRVVTNDSGLMHIAAALDRPMAAVFGSSSPGFTPPLSPKARVVSLQLACSPCFARVCPLGHTNCLETLPPDQVQAALP